LISSSSADTRYSGVTPIARMRLLDSAVCKIAAGSPLKRRLSSPPSPLLLFGAETTHCDRESRAPFLKRRATSTPRNARARVQRVRLIERDRIAGQSRRSRRVAGKEPALLQRIAHIRLTRLLQRGAGLGTPQIKGVIFTAVSEVKAGIFECLRPALMLPINAERHPRFHHPMPPRGFARR
jgi:hypothetical protein